MGEGDGARAHEGAVKPVWQGGFAVPQAGRAYQTVGGPARHDGAIGLHDLGMRLTYRTLRVLVAVAEHPGGSNRLIGTTAGIEDQGQISKLLARLQRGGLIANTGALPSKGAPNSWTLTPAGGQLVATVRAHTEGPKQGEHAR